MRESAADIATFTLGRTIEEFRTDKLLQRAVERGFEIVGEALSQLRKIDPGTAESISDWRAIIGFRNVLIHGYGAVNNDKTWDIVQTELPILQRELTALLPNP
jgi:uncharacterized protein with HEPN domain